MLAIVPNYDIGKAFSIIPFMTECHYINMMLEYHLEWCQVTDTLSVVIWARIRKKSAIFLPCLEKNKNDLSTHAA